MRTAERWQTRTRESLQMMKSSASLSSSLIRAGRRFSPFFFWQYLLTEDSVQVLLRLSCPTSQTANFLHPYFCYHSIEKYSGHSSGNVLCNYWRCSKLSLIFILFIKHMTTAHFLCLCSSISFNMTVYYYYF